MWKSLKARLRSLLARKPPDSDRDAAVIARALRTKLPARLRRDVGARDPD